MAERKKFLCVCQKGCNRSVFLTYRFKRHGHSAIPCGWLTESPETLDMLYSWADHIVLVQEEYRSKVPSQYQSKVLVVEIGHDDWGPRWHDELRRRAYAGLAKLEGVL